MNKLLLLTIAVIFTILVQAQTTDQNDEPVRYKITYISMDGEGYKPRNEYISFKQDGESYTIFYGGYEVYEMKFLEMTYNDSYYYVSEEGIEEPLVRASSDNKLSDLCNGDVSEGTIVISFECCLTEVISYKKIDKK